MAKMPAASVDAVVCDPPYGIRFMGKAWDGADIVAMAADRDRYSQDPDARAGANGGHKSVAAQAGKYDRSTAANRAFRAWTETWAREAFSVLKPGGHLLAFGGTRTYHRMVCAIEDAGFEIRDRILHIGGGDAIGAELAWVYGSG